MITPLIEVEELANCSADNTVIFDCRFSLMDTDAGYNDYLQGHIPGAHYLHLDNQLAANKSAHGGRHPLPTAEDFSRLMQQFGVNSDTQVVAYDDHRFGFASRLWWMLRYFGHANARVLNGGFKAWAAADQPVTTEIPEPRPGNFSANPNESMVVDYSDVKNHLHNEARILIDSREPLRYQGLQEPIDPIAGHIPGACNFPWQEVTTEQGFAHSPANQVHRWESLPRDKEMVVYCGSGVTACVNLLSMEMAGIKGAKLYAGSWSDWCSYQN